MKVSAPEWTFSNITPKEGAVFQGRFLTLLGEKTGLQITTAQDIAQAIGLERQKQLLGCDSEEPSCSAELAAALGSDAILSGSLAKAGSSFVVTLRGVNVANGQPFATASGRLATEDALFAFLESEATEFAKRMSDAFDLYVEQKRGPRAFRVWPWLIAGTGVVAAAVGVGLLIDSRTIYDGLISRTALPDDGYRASLTSGQRSQDVGVGLLVGGVISASAGVVLAFLTRVPVQVAVAPTPTGAVAVLGASW